MSTILVWFYSTYLGGLYFEFLLWLDRRNSNPTKLLSPKEMAQIIRESNKTFDGVSRIKAKVATLVTSNSKEEYERVLSEIEDLMNLADWEIGANTQQGQFAELLKNIYVKHGNRDIVTNTDKAKMIEGRIQDMHELWADKEKRKLLRDIRKAGQEGDNHLLNKLQTELRTKYGRPKRSSRLN